MYKMAHEEFRSIHNALIDLQNMMHVVPSAQVDRLIKIHSDLQEAMEGIRRQEAEEFNLRCERYASMRIACGYRAIWSKHDVELTDRHQYGPVKQMTYQGRSAKVLGRTWADLYSVADDLIRASGDNDHIFIEDFEPTGEDLLLVTGS